MVSPALDVEQLAAHGVELQRAGDIDGAIKAYQQALEIQPAQAIALYSLAAIHLNQGQPHEALAYAARCLRSAPASPLAWYIHGTALKTLRRFDEALRNFDQAISLDPNCVEALVEKANICLDGEDFAQALPLYERVLAVQPAHPVATKNRATVAARAPRPVLGFSELTLQGLALQNAGDIDGAQKVFSSILEKEPAHFVALYSLAAMAINQGRKEEGLEYGKRCLDGDPRSAYGWYIYGCALKSCRRFPEALQHLNRALELSPAYKEALMEKGIIHGETKDYVQALIQFNQVLTLDPEHKLALVNLATSLTILNRHKEGAQFFERLLKVDPGHDYAIGAMTHARLHGCEWTDFEKNRAQIIEEVQAGKRACKPLAFLALSDSPADQLICARTFNAQAYPLQAEQFWAGEKYQHAKPRVGYVSPDLREHPVGHLMAGVFEHHDKSKYEIYAFSLGVNDQSSLRARFMAASDHFVDVRGKSSREIAQIIRAAEIDLLVDLAGPTMDAQPDIFAFRPAPIQVNYLGYPGTSGAPYFDFIMADRTVIPEADRPHYDEEVVYVPGCYLPTDSKLKIAERTPTREEMKLPPEGFVFCSFNHDYKMNPDTFEVWMRILKRVEGSVLWLMRLNETAEANLRKEAEARGVSASRLIFAVRVPAVEDHLARYRLAGLFLDCHPYNAHSTATDAMRVGLPVLTYTGHSFQSRVATSVLNTVGLPQLSKTTYQEYEDFAVEMATSPEKLEKLKAEVREKASTSLLFDTQRTTEGHEAAWDVMLSKGPRKKP